MKKLLVIGILVFLAAGIAQALPTYGYADVVLDYYNSGNGSFSGPYGGTLANFPVPVSLDVVLGNDPVREDFLSLPTGSYVTVGFIDETVINGIGNDIFIREIGANGERANVYVSSNNTNFTFLGIANDETTTSFDLASINYLSPVTAIKIVGLDSLGGSPGFDVVNVQVLPGSIGPRPVVVPAPGALVLAMMGTGLVSWLRRKQIL